MALINVIKRPFYGLYQKRLEARVREHELPDHIGIVLDGNRRFARMHQLPSVMHGHAKGADKLDEVLGWCYEFGISIVTIWIFSTDNFSRPESEVAELLALIEDRIRELPDLPKVHQYQVQTNFIGRLELLPESLQKTMTEVRDKLAHYKQNTLNVAIAYGGREEIVDAARNCMRAAIADGRDCREVIDSLKAEDIDEYLYTKGQPDPDLIIRTSGEIRLSGFLLWQSAYSEFYFCDTYWPAFRRVDFLRALRDYQHRKRRFGK
jgi:short-chain Z-isoprenyl diphosphate synthase